MRDLRTGIDDERKAYEDDRVKTGKKMGQVREAPDKFKLEQAQKKVALAENAALEIERTQMVKGSRLQKLGQTLIDEKEKLAKELARMRECAAKAQAAHDMTKFKELFGGVGPDTGVTMNCEAVEAARKWMNKPWREAVAGLEPFRQGGQAPPSKGAAQAHNFKLADASRIRLDVPRLLPNGRDFADNDRPHMAVYPPRDNEHHLTVDGVVVPANTATAHIPLLAG